MRAICDEAHQYGVIVGAHAQSPEGVRRSLLAGVDTIEHGSVLDDELIGMFRHNPNALRGYSALVPTLSAGLPLTRPASPTSNWRIPRMWSAAWFQVPVKRTRPD